jgi:excisionase family DNA binding protein
MEKLMSPKEVATATGLKISYLYHLTHHKRIPHLKVGSTVKFRMSEINKWLTSCVVPTEEKPKQKVKREPKVKKNTHAKRLAEKVKNSFLKAF